MAENIVSTLYNTTYDFLAKTFTATKTANGDIYTAGTLSNGYTGIQLAHDPVRPAAPPVEGANVTIWYYDPGAGPSFKGTALQEIFTGEPLVSQYRVDYGESTDGYATGQVRMNPADTGLDLVVDMNHIGSILEWGNIKRYVDAAVALAISAFAITDSPTWTETAAAASARATQEKITQALSAVPPLPGYLYGGEVSNNGTSPNTKLDVASGYRVDDTNTLLITLPAWTLDLGATWTAGNGNGKLESGALAANMTYHIFVIANADGSGVDYLASTSLTPMIPGGRTRKRRVGSRQTDGSGNLIQVVQNGDWHIYKNIFVPVDGVAITVGGALYNMGTPTGLKLPVRGIISPGLAFNGAGGMSISLTSPNVNNAPPSTGAGWTGNRGLASTYYSSYWWSTETEFTEITDASGNLRMDRNNVAYNGSLYYTTVQIIGYIDTRGRDGGV